MLVITQVLTLDFKAMSTSKDDDRQLQCLQSSCLSLQLQKMLLSTNQGSLWSEASTGIPHSYVPQSIPSWYSRRTKAGGKLVHGVKYLKVHSIESRHIFNTSV